MMYTKNMTEFFTIISHQLFDFRNNTLNKKINFLFIECSSESKNVRIYLHTILEKQ